MLMLGHRFQVKLIVRITLLANEKPSRSIGRVVLLPNGSNGYKASDWTRIGRESQLDQAAS